MLVSCATPVYKLHELSHVQPDKIAVLKDSPGSGGLDVFVESVDGITPPDARGNKSTYGSKFRIELLPGKHTLSIRYISKGSSGYYSVQTQEVSFYAEGGKVYTVKASQGTIGTTWKAWVEEIDDNVK